jgi:metal-sulfur cluster biosynthetic enzyme
MPRELLREVIDLEIGINIVGLGLVYDVRLAVGVVAVRMTLTTPGCPLGGYINDAIHQCLRGAPHRRDPAAGRLLSQPSQDPLPASPVGRGVGTHTSTGVAPVIAFGP